MLVVNAMGRIFMDPLDDPFAAVERELAACPLRQAADAIIVDIHGEATSEKQAMGHFCDGRASLVIGTHTHAPTADHQILPHGTAFISDVGMTGDYNSVIGMDKNEPLGAVPAQDSRRALRAGDRRGDLVRARGRDRRRHRAGAARRRRASRRQAGSGAADILGVTLLPFP